MNFSVLPPEINSALMLAGAGSGPMLAAANAWNGLAAELDSAARSFTSVASDLAGQAWQGPASQAMMAAATPYASFLNTASTNASHASTQAQAVAGAFESALAATVHPATIAANRSSFVSLVVSNLFGQNAPAIAAAECHYEEMWAQDVMALVGYHGGASAAATQLAALPAATFDTFQNLGFANFGYGNVGIGNTGIGNVGMFNYGNLNIGIGNYGAYNVGIGLTGTGQIGIGGFDWLNPFNRTGYYGGYYYPYY
jgi:PPE-repeat protein